MPGSKSCQVITKREKPCELPAIREVAGKRVCRSHASHTLRDEIEALDRYQQHRLHADGEYVLRAEVLAIFDARGDAVKIRARSGEIIDLDDIRKEQVFIGNPYAVDNAILIKHNTALLDALEAALDVQTSTPASDTWQRGWNACKNAVRDAVGVIEESV